MLDLKGLVLMTANARLNSGKHPLTSVDRVSQRFSRRPLLIRCRLGFHNHGHMRWFGQRLVGECSFCGASLERKDGRWREIGVSANRHLETGNLLVKLVTRNPLIRAVCRMLGSGMR